MIPKQVLEELYLERKLSEKRIAKLLGKSSCAIHKTMLRQRLGR